MLAVKLHRVRQMALSKSMHWYEGGSNHRRTRYRLGHGTWVHIEGESSQRETGTLARYRNSYEGQEYSTAHGLLKDLRWGKNTEKQHVLQLGTSLAVGVSGDDLVVVHQAFFVDESLNNDRVATLGKALGQHRCAVKETRTGGRAKGLITRQQWLRGNPDE